MRLCLLIFLIWKVEVLYSQTAGNLLPIKVDYKWGFMDWDGKIKVEPKFNALSEFDYGYAVARVESGVGIIDTGGEFKVEPKYQSCLVLDSANFGVSADGKWSLINDRMEVMLHSIDKITKLTSHILLLEYSNHKSLYHLSTKKELEVDFSSIKAKEGNIIIGNPLGYGLINTNLEHVFPSIFDDFPILAETHIVVKKDNRFAIASHSGEFYSDFDYSSIKESTFNALILEKSDKTKDLFYFESRKLLALEYPTTDFLEITDQLLAFVSDKKVGLISTQGEILIDPEFSEFRMASDAIVARKGAQMGLVSMKGEILVEPDLSKIGKFNNGLAYVKRYDRIGVIRKDGRIIVRPNYDYVEIVDDQIKAYRGTNMTLVTLENNNVTEVINFNNVRQIRVDTKFDFDEIETRAITNTTNKDDSLAVAHGWRFNPRLQLWGLPFPNGQMAVPYKYQKVYVIDSTYSIGEVRGAQTPQRAGFNQLYTEGPRIYYLRGAILSNETFYQFVNHRRYRIASDDAFWYVNYNDLRRYPVGKIVRYGLHGIVQRNGKYDFFLPGQNPNTPLRISKLGDFQDDRARVCVDGRLKYEYNDLIQENQRPLYDSIKTGISERLLRGSCGYIDTNGNIVVYPKFENVSDFYKERSIVTSNNLKGLVDINGKVILEPTFEDIDFITLAGNEYIRVYSIGSHVGILGMDGKIKIDPVYDDIGNFHEGYAWFRKENKYGFVDTAGNEVIPASFDGAKDFKEGVAPVRVGLNWGYVNHSGDMKIEPSFREAFSFQEGIARVRVRLETRYINRNGAFIQNDKLSYGEDMDKGYAVAGKSKRGLMDSVGNWVIPQKYQSLNYLPDYKLAIAKKGRKYFLLNLDGEKVVKERLYMIRPFSEGKALVKFKSRFGFIDSTGTVVLQNYTSANSFSDSLARVRIDGNWVFINHSGEEIFTVPYNRITDFKEGRAFYYSGGYYGIMNKNGEIVRQPEYLQFNEYSEGKAMVCNSNECYFINQDGIRMFGGLSFQQGTSFNEGRAAIMLNNKWRVIDDSGFTISADKMDGVETYEKGYAIFHFNIKQGLMDLDAKEVFDPRFNLVEAVGLNFYKLEQGDHLGYYHIEKGWVWPLTK